MPTPANSQLFCDNERAFIDVLPDGPHEQRESARDYARLRDRPRPARGDHGGWHLLCAYVRVRILPRLIVERGAIETFRNDPRPFDPWFPFHWYTSKDSGWTRTQSSSKGRPNGWRRRSFRSGTVTWTRRGGCRPRCRGLRHVHRLPEGQPRRNDRRQPGGPGPQDPVGDPPLHPSGPLSGRRARRARSPL
jgi:hypothetical protein